MQGASGKEWVLTKQARLQHWIIVWEPAWKAGSWSAHLPLGSAHLPLPPLLRISSTCHTSSDLLCSPSRHSLLLEPHYPHCSLPDNITAVPSLLLKLLLRVPASFLSSHCLLISHVWHFWQHSTPWISCFLLHHVLFFLLFSKGGSCFLRFFPLSLLFYYLPHIHTQLPPLPHGPIHLYMIVMK